MIVFHELGHCVLDKVHVKGKIDIMNAVLKLSNPEQYQNNWDKLLEDFFNDDMPYLGGDVSLDFNEPCTYK